MKSALMQLELTISWAPRTGEMRVVFLLPGGAPQESAATVDIVRRMTDTIETASRALRARGRDDLTFMWADDYRRPTPGVCVSLDSWGLIITEIREACAAAEREAAHHVAEVGHA
jgi:hypothetical protein